MTTPQNIVSQKSLGFWSGEAASVELVGKDLKAEKKMEVSRSFFEKTLPSLQAALQAFVGQEILCELLENVMIPGSELVINTEAVIPCAWKNNQKNIDGLFLIDRSFFFWSYTRLFGGLRSFEAKRPFSDFELGILTQLEETLLKTISTPWVPSGVAPFQTSQSCLSPEEVNQLKWTADVLKTTFQLTIGEEKKNMTFVLAAEVLNLVVGQEDNHSVAGEGEMGIQEEWANVVMQAVGQCKVPMQVVLGELRMPLETALNLKSDMIFPLQSLGSDYPITLNGKNFGRGLLGKTDENRAIKIN